MSEELLLVEKEGHICTLTINRPERRNSLNPEIMLSLGETFSKLKSDSEVRVVVIRGAGEEAFSSGFDIGRIGEGGREDAGWNPLRYGLESLQNYPYPVIAMIYGYAVGAGLELAVTCDFRLAADSAKLGITPAKLGVVYSYVGIQRFMNLIGIAGTKELFFTGRIINAHRAKEMGLVDEVVPAKDLADATYGLAREIAENSPLSISGTKAIISMLLKCQKPSPEDEAKMNALRTCSMESEDLQEGRRAFMEKRKPRFVGR